MVDTADRQARGAPRCNTVRHGEMHSGSVAANPGVQSADLTVLFAGSLAAGVVASGFFDAPLSVAESDAGFAAASPFSEEPLADLPDVRLSLMYQPDPLNTTPTGCTTRLTGWPQIMHSVNGSSANFCTVSNS